MKIFKLLILFLLASTTLATASALVPLEISAIESCKENIVDEPTLTIADWPKNARDRAIDAYVVISYELDGSGKPIRLKIIDSKPAGLFDATTISILERTNFTLGIKSESCTYIRTYGAVKRRS